MYYIKRDSDGMWLMGQMDGDCAVPTCIWGQHKRDALPFEDVCVAEATAKIIGGCTVVFMSAGGTQS